MQSSAKAAAGAVCQGSERRLVRTLYKALVCSARTFEHEPALNALIYRRTAPRAAPSTASDEDEDADTTPAETTPTTPMDEVYDEFLSSKQLRFFHPDVSRRTVLEVVRQRFQQPLPLSPEAPPSSLTPNIKFQEFANDSSS